MNENKVPFCTCDSLDCPNHPTNHDKGCTPCIRKNLALGEIPSCFFNLAGITGPQRSYKMEEFARLLCARESKE